MRFSFFLCLYPGSPLKRFKANVDVISHGRPSMARFKVDRSRACRVHTVDGCGDAGGGYAGPLEPHLTSFFCYVGSHCCVTSPSTTTLMG